MSGDGHLIDSFLEMMSAERGAAPNTLLSYRRDLEDYGHYLSRAGTDFENAGIGEEEDACTGGGYATGGHCRALQEVP